MSVLPIPVLVTKSVGSKNEFRVPISILSASQKKIIATTAVIDSGAGGSFISETLIKKHSISTHRLKEPFNIRTVDGSYSTAGQVTHYCILLIKIDRRVMVGKFNITKLSRKDDILLGFPWLAAIQPDIDWAKKTISLPPTEKSHAMEENSSRRNQ